MMKGTLLNLRNKYFDFLIDPDFGGAILRGQFNLGEGWLDFMPNTTDTRHFRSARGKDGSLSMTLRKGLAESSFVMVPYSNRIKDGFLQLQGAAYQLRRGYEHAIHGDLWHRRASIKTNQKSKVELFFRCRGEGCNWPCGFETVLTYELSGRRFISSIEIKNIGSMAFAFEGGFHPYFLKQIIHDQHKVSPAELISNVTERLDTIRPGISESGKFFKDEKTELLTSGFNLVEEKTDFDDFFRITSGSFAHLIYRDLGVRLSLKDNQNIRGIVVYNQPASEFAVEPVSHVFGRFDFEPLAPGCTKLISYETSLEFTP